MSFIFHFFKKSDFKFSLTSSAVFYEVRPGVDSKIALTANGGLYHPQAQSKSCNLSTRGLAP